MISTGNYSRVFLCSGSFSDTALFGALSSSLDSGCAKFHPGTVMGWKGEACPWGESLWGAAGCSEVSPSASPRVCSSDSKGHV